MDPKVLARYLEAIADDMEDTAPDYEPVFTDVYQYYGNLLASFTNTIDDLILQLPILIKLKVQIPMSLCRKFLQYLKYAETWQSMSVICYTQLFSVTFF